MIWPMENQWRTDIFKSEGDWYDVIYLKLKYAIDDFQWR